MSYTGAIVGFGIAKLAFCSRRCPFEFFRSIQILSQSEGGGIEML